MFWGIKDIVGVLKILWGYCGVLQMFWGIKDIMGVLQMFWGD